MDWNKQQEWANQDDKTLPQKLISVRLYGDSMLPTLKSGITVKIAPIKNCTYIDVEIGEIVTYWSKGFNKDGKHCFWLQGNTCHRIIGKTKAYALIKGDNRNYIEKVPYNKINGKLVAYADKSQRGLWQKISKLFRKW
ncbi:MAG: S26 family signal peptidase [Candidatus Micrarchaeaceae archaeon]